MTYPCKLYCYMADANYVFLSLWRCTSWRIYAVLSSCVWGEYSHWVAAATHSDSLEQMWIWTMKNQKKKKTKKEQKNKNSVVLFERHHTLFMCPGLTTSSICACSCTAMLNAVVDAAYQAISIRQVALSQIIVVIIKKSYSGTAHSSLMRRAK